MANSLLHRLENVEDSSKIVKKREQDENMLQDNILKKGNDNEISDDEKKTDKNEILRYLQKKILQEYPSILGSARNDINKRNYLFRIIDQILAREVLIVRNMPRNELAEYILNEIIGYGPIDAFIRSDRISEIMVNGSRQVFVEEEGQLIRTSVEFENDEHLLSIIERIVTPIGRRIDQSSPYVDARLPDGSRVHAIIPPLSLSGPILTIRKFPKVSHHLETLIKLGSLTPEMAIFIEHCVKSKMNVLISGGTGSGKTTLLNALSGCIPNATERVITIEDSAELKLNQDHIISLETRPPNIEGKGEVTIRQLLRNALRMRPDRIIIGECRGAEAFDMLQAMNTGHSGSLTTIHANNAKDALSRLENMVMMAGESLPYNVIREQVLSAIDVVIHVMRMHDGSRKVTSISIVDKDIGENMQATLHGIFQFRAQGKDNNGKITGKYQKQKKNDYPDFFKEKMKTAGYLN